VKATLEFNLDDPADQERHRRYMKADDMAYVLHSIAQDGERNDVPPEVIKEVTRWCEDNNIDFEEIYT